MKLEALFESSSKEDIFLNYIWSDILFENRAKEFKGFLTTKSGKTSTLKALDFLKTLSEKSLADLKSMNDFVDDLSFSGNVLNSRNSFSIYHYDLIGPPPFKIGKVVNEFLLAEATTLKELPDWFPTECKTLYVQSAGIESLHNIHKIVKKCEHLKFYRCPLKSSILGILQIAGLKRFSFEVPDHMVDAHPVDGAYNNLDRIISKYVKMSTNERDIFEFQEELIDNGWKEYAKL